MHVSFSDVPSKLYFDSDIDKTRNTGISFDSLIKTLIDLVNQQIEADLKLKSTPDEVLILDASGPAKFSNHLVFHNVTFNSNLICKQFVLSLLPVFDTKLPVIFDANGNQSSIVDMSVYSKNQNLYLNYRQWRLIFSCLV